MRKISPTTIEILSTATWADIIPDSALSALDQRIIKLDAQMRALSEYVPGGDVVGVDDLIHDEDEDTLQLSANGVPVGRKVSIKNMMEDGIPVVDISSSENESEPDEDDGIVEF